MRYVNSSRMQVLFKLKVAICNHWTIVSYLGGWRIPTYIRPGVLQSRGNQQKKLLACTSQHHHAQTSKHLPIRFDMGWHPILFEKPASLLGHTCRDVCLRMCHLCVSIVMHYIIFTLSCKYANGLLQALVLGI